VIVTSFGESTDTADTRKMYKNNKKINNQMLDQKIVLSDSMREGKNLTFFNLFLLQNFKTGFYFFF